MLLATSLLATSLLTTVFGCGLAGPRCRDVEWRQDEDGGCEVRVSGCTAPEAAAFPGARLACGDNGAPSNECSCLMDEGGGSSLSDVCARMELNSFDDRRALEALNTVCGMEYSLE